MVYVIARTASGRPTLQHELVVGSASETVCGNEMRGWSRAFQDAKIPQVFCRRCEKGN